MKTRLHAPDISCNHCAMTIKRELAALEGLGAVNVDVPSKTIDLQYKDAAVLEKAMAVLENIGYPATKA